jgi:fumarate hydratase, class II
MITPQSNIGASRPSPELPGFEADRPGSPQVPPERLWDAQTESARRHFQIGQERFRWGRPVIRALGLVKLCATEANRELGSYDSGPSRLSPASIEAILEASREVMEGRWDEEFPLGVFQSGSGTQTHMNANEVIARRSTRIAYDKGVDSHVVHPNDHVNRGQSSNDVIPTVMHVATVMELQTVLLPAVRALRDTLATRARDFAEVVMVGRTHLQDATPVTLGQAISGWVAQLDDGIEGVERSIPALCKLAIGGTAVGTGMNAHPEFGERVAARLAAATGQPFVSAANKFAALSGQEPMVATSAALRTLAGALLKIANDVRWYASGPRAGIGELEIPANEPGSSIMPGKVNPTQCEALAMVALQVYGNDQTVAIAGSQGNFQLNVYKPVILHNVLESVALLADACRSFRVHCAEGICPNLPRIEEHLSDSLMLVTALTGEIGYDRAAEIARRAHRDGINLRDAARQSGVAAEVFDRCISEALRQTAEASRRQLRGN